MHYQCCLGVGIAAPSGSKAAPALGTEVLMMPLSTCSSNQGLERPTLGDTATRVCSAEVSAFLLLLSSSCGT